MRASAIFVGSVFLFVGLIDTGYAQNCPPGTTFVGVQEEHVDEDTIVMHPICKPVPASPQIPSQANPHVPYEHCMKECQGGCSAVHSSCLKRAQTEAERRHCTKDYGDCRERYCPQLCEKTK